jgi:hypothetical protein
MNTHIATGTASNTKYRSVPASPGLHSSQPIDTPETDRRGPHPGDVAFWVACVGGACLLLFLAT